MGFKYYLEPISKLPILNSFNGCSSLNLRPSKMGSHILKTCREQTKINNSGVTEGILMLKVSYREQELRHSRNSISILLENGNKIQSMEVLLRAHRIFQSQDSLSMETLIVSQKQKVKMNFLYIVCPRNIWIMIMEFA